MKGYIKPRDRRKRRAGPCRVWQLVVHLGYDEQGKRKTLYRTFHGKKSDAQIALDELKAQVRGAPGAPVGDHTFAHAFERWLAVKRHEAGSGDPPPIDVQTVEQYHGYARVHLLPRLGSQKLRDIKDFEIKEFIEDLRLRGRKGRDVGSGLTISTVRRIRYVLNSVFEYACEMGWVLRNVVSRVRLPRQTNNTEYRVLTDSEAHRLVVAARGSRLHLVIFIAAVTGARRGEILALVWDDIDFDTKEIRIRRALRHNATTKRPKTKSGTRTLALPDELARQLLAHRKVQKAARERYGAGYDDRGFIFADEAGRPWKPNSISTLYRRIVRDAGIGKVKLHELRHSLASILIANGVDLATVAKILGHSDESFTARQYVHPAGVNDRKAENVMKRRARAAA